MFVNIIVPLHVVVEMVAIIRMLQGMPSLTANTIRTFIGTRSSTEGTGWFTGRKLDHLFDDEKCSNILQDKLKNIELAFEEIKLNTEGTELEHMHNRIYQAEMDICLKFQILQTILANEKNKDKRDIEVERLQTGILDTNNGVLSNLSVIHQELVGHTINSGKKGLLATWYKFVCKNMIENPMSAKTCYDNVIKYLDKAAILQFKGFLLFRGANENSQLCSAQFKCLKKNLKSQSDLLDTTISKLMKDLINPNENSAFYLRPVSNIRFKPFVKRRGEHKTLFYEYHLEHINEEKWTFEKSRTFKEDGSLIISGFSSGKDSKQSFLSATDENKAICVPLKDNAQPLFVMPLDEKTCTKISMHKMQPESQVDHFLDTDLKFNRIKKNIEFTITKADDTPKDEFDVLFPFKNWLR